MRTKPSVVGARKRKFLIGSAPARRRKRRTQVPNHRFGPATAVLVVEEHGCVRELATTFLREAGYSVLAVAGQRQATNVLEDQYFDVLVTDLSLPDGSGLELAKAAGARLPKIKVLMCSAALPNDYEFRFPGVDGSLPKPFTRRMLCDAVRNLRAGAGLPD